MRYRGKNLLLSVVAVLTVVSLLTSATVAWFADTAEMTANFESGVLDITLNGLERNQGGSEVVIEALSFKNLRPMQLDDFHAMKKESEAGSKDRLFQKIQVCNKGSLPVYLAFQLEEQVPPDGETLPVVPNGDGGVQRPDEEHPALPCHNDLKDKLQVFLYTEDGEPIANADLMRAPYGKEAGEQILLLAGESKSYYLGGYIPENTPSYEESLDDRYDYNMYNGGHYHAKLAAIAWQVDAEASSSLAG